MAKFNNTKMDRQIEGFVKQSNETTKIPYIQMISNENLIDYTSNNEDTSDLTDLENSIREIGFTDPIEVTNINSGKYMILSGHRRRAAGANIGLKEFPCLVLPLKKENDIQNYVLLANSHRDSSKDPLLYCKRYKMHEAYLDKIGFQGIKRDEIAKRLGISTAQADRYKRFNEIIAPVWELVRNEKVGMSSVLSMSTLPIADQEAIYEIFVGILKYEEHINREKCDLIIKKYSASHNTDEILQMFQNQQSVMPGISIDDDIEDPSSDSDGMVVSPANNDADISVKKSGQIERALRLEKNVRRLSKILSDDYKFPDNETANLTVRSMFDLIETLATQINTIASTYDISDRPEELKYLIDSYISELRGMMVP